MINRQPTPGKEGRVHIVPENGNPDYYARIEMADDPLEPGTQFVKETMLQDDTAQAYNLDGAEATPDDVFKRQIITTDIKSLCGLSSAATLNDVIQRLAIGFGKYLWTVKVLDQDGSPIPNVLVHADGQEGDYPSVVSVTDENGVAQVVAPSPATIGVNDWFDYQKTKEEFTASGVSFNQSVTLNLQRKTSAYELIEESGDKIFSPMLVSADITAVGGGGSGESPLKDTGAAAGAGGEIKTLKKYDMQRGKEITLSVDIGVGGERVDSDALGGKNGISGGTTTVKNGSSTILSAAGGTGGFDRNGGTSSNGGNGGYGGTSSSPNAGNGGDATANIFDDASVGKLASGGGGGSGYEDGLDGSGGLPNGGAGGIDPSTGDGYNGKAPGGGGGAGDNGRASGAGANGGVYMRFYWE